MKILTCVALLDNTSSEKIKKIMTKISIKCKSKNALSFPPHISLRAYFEIEDNKIDTLIENLNEVISSFRKINLQTTTYNFYPWKIIFLDTKKNITLHDLHIKLMNIIQKYRTEWVPNYLLENTTNFKGKQRKYIEKYGYQFAFEYFSQHITVAGNDMTQELFEKIKTELSDKQENMEIRIDKVALIDINNKKIIKSFSLSL